MAHEDRIRNERNEEPWRQDAERRRKLTLKPRTETGVVRQSFSHGRSKQVVVEKVKSAASLGATQARGQAPQPRAGRQVARKPAAAPAKPRPLRPAADGAEAVRRRAAHPDRGGARRARPCARPTRACARPRNARSPRKRRAVAKAAKSIDKAEREAAEARKREEEDRRKHDEETKRKAGEVAKKRLRRRTRSSGRRPARLALEADEDEGPPHVAPSRRRARPAAARSAAAPQGAPSESRAAG